MDRPMPSFIVGMHGSERDAQNSFAWTSGHVVAGIRSRSAGGVVVHVEVPRIAANHRDRQLQLRSTANRVERPRAERYRTSASTCRPSAVGARLRSLIRRSCPAAATRGRSAQVDTSLPAVVTGRPPPSTHCQCGARRGTFAAGLALVGLSLSSAMFAAAAIGLGQTVMLAIDRDVARIRPRCRGWRSAWCFRHL
jgi:hypothetical protein